MKVKKCCCCVAVDMGVMILGTLMCFGIMAEFKEFNPVRAAITVVAGSLFFLMVFRDIYPSEWTTKWDEQREKGTFPAKI